MNLSRRDTLIWSLTARRGARERFFGPWAGLPKWQIPRASGDREESYYLHPRTRRDKLAQLWPTIRGL